MFLGVSKASGTMRFIEKTITLGRVRTTAHKRFCTLLICLSLGSLQVFIVIQFPPAPERLFELWTKGFLFISMCLKHMSHMRD